MRTLQHKRSIYFLAISLLALGLCTMSCDELLEDDISNRPITLLSPSDNTETESSTINFWWEAVDRATSYRLEVVSPTFANASSLLLDSITTDTKIQVELLPGTYAWRVKALNSVSETLYADASFTIKAPVDISSKQVELTAPENELITAQTNIQFQWKLVEHAHIYKLVVKQPDWAGQTVGEELTTTENSLTVELPEGEYVWGIQAVDTLHNISTPFVTRELIIDTTEPSLPVAKSPLQDTVLTTLTVNFVWETETATQDFETHLEVYADYYMNNKLVEYTTDGTDYTYTFQEKGIYYWRLQNRDHANNTSAYSELIAFELAPHEDISAASINLVAPAAGYTTRDTEINFWWDELEGAQEYELQIVTPSFAAPQALKLDTTITGNTFQWTATPGVYEWRVRGINDQYATGYSAREFNINGEPDLSSKQVNILSPANGVSTTLTTLTFWWDEVEGAESYVLQVVKPTFEAATHLIEDSELTENKKQLTLSAGEYQWRVKAVNSSSETPFTTYSLTVE